LSSQSIFYLNLLLGILLLITAIIVIRDVTSRYFEHKKNIQKSTFKPRDLSAQKPEKQLSEYASVLANNPFGFPGGEIRALTGLTAQGARQADIILIGTVVGPRELSYGIFRDSAGKQEIFKIGDAVFDIGKLYGVEREKVLIRKGAETEEILLDDVKVKDVKRQASAVGTSSSTFAQRVGKATYLVDQKHLQQSIANPAQMMTDARLRPNVVDGKEEGFVVSEVKPGGIYHSLGLQDGDILLRINEYDISNPEKALQAFTALKGMDQVQVDLVRAGSRMTMTYLIK